MKPFLVVVLCLTLSPALAAEWDCKTLNQGPAVRNDILEDAFSLHLEEPDNFIAYCADADTRWSWSGKWIIADRTLAMVGSARWVWENPIDQSETIRSSEVQGVAGGLGLGRFVMKLTSEHGQDLGVLCKEGR